MKKRAILKINDNMQFDVATSISLLSALNENKIFLPSICGGRGICGKCKCTVLQGGGDIQAAELKRLSQNEIKTFIRLACQVQIEEDIRIEIPNVILGAQEFEAEVDSIMNLVHDIKLVRLRLIHPEEIQFKSGQYIQLKSNPYQNVNQSVMRSYSIASPFWSKKQIDLMIRLVPAGICSTWVHQFLLEKEHVFFVGPRGDFILKDGEEDIVMVAGGSGMAPMVSILHELTAKMSTRKIVYFFGACKKKDLFYLDEMKAIESKLPHFRFVPVLSQPDKESSCNYETGLVTHPLNGYLQQNKTSKLHLYLCGSPGMIQNCKTIAAQNGVLPENIFHDAFT